MVDAAAKVAAMLSQGAVPRRVAKTNVRVPAIMHSFRLPFRMS